MFDLDRDGDGTVDFSEFISWLLKEGQFLSTLGSTGWGSTPTPQSQQQNGWGAAPAVAGGGWSAPQGGGENNGGTANMV